MKEKAVTELLRAKQNLMTTKPASLSTRKRDDLIRDEWLKISIPGSSVEIFLDNLTCFDDDKEFELLEKGEL